MKSLQRPWKEYNVIILLAVFILSVLLTNSKVLADIPPEIPDVRSTHLFLPYNWSLSDGGEAIMNEVSNDHDYSVMQDMEAAGTINPTVTLEDFRSAISGGGCGIFWVHTHGGHNLLAVESYDISLPGARGARDAAYLTYIGADEFDPEVRAAIANPEGDGVDNDNDGDIDEPGETYISASDDDEDGVYDEGGTDPPGDANGDGAPGVKGEDDDLDGEYTTDEISDGGTAESYCICVTGQFVDNYATMADSIVFLAACHSATLNDNFVGPNKARNSFGYPEETNANKDRQDTRIIFYNMGGKINERRNESVREAYDRITSDLELESDPTSPPDAEDEKIYNSPRIIKLELKEDKDDNGTYETLIYKYEFATDYPYNPNDYTNYPGSLDICSKNCASPGNIQIEIKFSKRMDTGWGDLFVRFDPQGEDAGADPLDFTGGWSPTTLPNDTWIGTANIPSENFDEYVGGAIIQVRARDSFQGDQNEELDTNGDGNSNGIDANHTFCIGTPLDLIFTIDTTGSMWDDIDAVKASATEIVNTIDSKISDYRVAVVDYRDFPVYPYGGSGDYPYHVDLPFSTDKSTIISAIQGLSLGWGADWQESVYSALIRSINTEGLGEWRNGVKKVVILMGDAPPHDPEPFTGYTLSSVVAAAEAVDPASIYPIAIGGDSTTYSYFSTLAEETGGEVFIALTAADLVEAIIKAIETSLEAPIADANGPYSGTAGSPITFDASGSYDTDGEIVSYEWDFDNDGIYDETVTTPITTYTYFAEYSGLVKLRVTDNDGLIAINTAFVQVVGNQPPTADAGSDRTVEVGSGCMGTVTLNGSGSSDPDGDQLTYTWTWDGNSATDVSPTIQLPLGTFTITLVVNDGTVDSDPDTVDITVVDTTPPGVEVKFPVSSTAFQDGVTLTAEASDACGVAEVYFCVREPGGAGGIPIGFEDLAGTLNNISGAWEHDFDTTQLPDGYYVVIAKAIDTNDNEGWSQLVSCSIRNWAIVELLPASEKNKAGRTMPVKFSLRIAPAVDPAQPFVYNEELEIRIYDASEADTILQTSVHGDTSRDYRIDTVAELYITNFKTMKQPATYVVEVWRMSKNFQVGSFSFKTVK